MSLTWVRVRFRVCVRIRVGISVEVRVWVGVCGFVPSAFVL